MERLPQQDRLIKICIDAGLLKTVKVGQYFMTKHTDWRVLTIYRTSGMSWVHFAKRRKIIWPEKLDSREHQDWTRVESHNQLIVRSIWTWATRRRTTTSRRPLRRSLKKSRWKRMYLLLQADQRLKQNQEDLPLLAHLQELYLFVKDYGLTLSQELYQISLTQCQ